VKTSICTGLNLDVLCEPLRYQDPTTLKVDGEHAFLDQRERKAAVELEHVVRHPGGDVLHATEDPASSFLDGETDELKDVELPLRRLGQSRTRNGELGAPLRFPVEQHDQTAAGALRLDDDGRLAADEELRPRSEALRVLARALDDESSVEPMPSADTADRN
jgi:hypothetical protein